MDRFNTLTSVAAPLMDDDVDTDVIFPARFLLIMERAGLAACLFADRRAEAAAAGQPFVLDRPPFDRAAILVAGANFGCGSSRENAVWALTSFGVRCVIAPSFGEIFYGNCLKNGVLPIRLSPGDVARLAVAAEAGRELHVDLEAQTVTAEGEAPIGFLIDPAAREALLNGWDEVALILRTDGEAIAAFEAAHRQRQPWLFLDTPP